MSKISISDAYRCQLLERDIRSKYFSHFLDLFLNFQVRYLIYQLGPVIGRLRDELNTKFRNDAVFWRTGIFQKIFGVEGLI